MNFPQSGPLSSDTVTRNKIVFTIVLIVCISSGIISFVMFHVQQNCTNKKQHMFSDEQVKLPDKVRWNLWSIAKETSTRSIEREKTKQHKKRNQGKVKKISLALKDLILTGFEYGNILRESFVWNMLGHPIWATVNILVTFLPGIEWYSFKRHQVPGKLSNFVPKIMFQIYTLSQILLFKVKSDCVLKMGTISLGSSPVFSSRSMCLHLG